MKARRTRAPSTTLLGVGDLMDLDDDDEYLQGDTPVVGDQAKQEV